MSDEHKYKVTTRPRLTVDISHAQKRTLDEKLPVHGMRTAVMQKLIEGLCAGLSDEATRGPLINAVLNSRITAVDLLKLEAKDGNTGVSEDTVPHVDARGASTISPRGVEQKDHSKEALSCCAETIFHDGGTP